MVLSTFHAILNSPKPKSKLSLSKQPLMICYARPARWPSSGHTCDRTFRKSEDANRGEAIWGLAAPGVYPWPLGAVAAHHFRPSTADSEAIRVVRALVKEDIVIRDLPLAPPSPTTPDSTTATISAAATTAAAATTTATATTTAAAATATIIPASFPPPVSAPLDVVSSLHFWMSSPPKSDGPNLNPGRDQPTRLNQLEMLVAALQNQLRQAKTQIVTLQGEMDLLLREKEAGLPVPTSTNPGYHTLPKTSERHQKSLSLTIPDGISGMWNRPLSPAIGEAIHKKESRSPLLENRSPLFGSSPTPKSPPQFSRPVIPPLKLSPDPPAAQRMRPRAPTPLEIPLPDGTKKQGGYRGSLPPLEIPTPPSGGLYLPPLSTTSSMITLGCLDPADWEGSAQDELALNNAQATTTPSSSASCAAATPPAAPK
ncbi:hypothetical protein PAPYR_5749 [Paratrimastix pyriformis]|uniref:Uncharacterized protein n=1 Tax=Paratrimastix pyriformis TaxID=342808 RepID=A0ABQ8UH44_9EUKA|nr:hypothetical protein PAPYR_5749 [Paratrimastix pyriformis]